MQSTRVHREVKIDEPMRLSMYCERLRDFTIVGDTIYLGHFLEAKDVGYGVLVVVYGVVVPIRIQTHYVSFLADHHTATIRA